MKFRHPSRGTKAAIFLPFLISCTRTHFRIAEFGCFASIPIFSTTMPLAIDAPPRGLAFMAVSEWLLLNSLFAHRWTRLWLRNLRPARIPWHFPMVQDALIW